MLASTDRASLQIGPPSAYEAAVTSSYLPAGDVGYRKADGATAAIEKKERVMLASTDRASLQIGSPSAYEAAVTSSYLPAGDVGYRKADGATAATEKVEVEGRRL